MQESGDIGLDSLYCGKRSKHSKSRRELDLDQTIPNVELVQAIYILQYVQVSSGLNHYSFKLSCTKIHRHTDSRQPEIQT